MNNLSNEDIEFLKQLSNELKTQDTFCTANPVYYQIAEPTTRCDLDKEYETPCSTHICFGDYDSEEFLREEDLEEIKIQLLENFDIHYGNNKNNVFYDEDEHNNCIEEINTISTFEEVTDFLDMYSDIEHHFRYEFEDIKYHNAFLTHKAAKRHIELNKYHYDKHKEPYTYCQYAGRNPELERLLEIVKKF